MGVYAVFCLVHVFAGSIGAATNVGATAVATVQADLKGQTVRIRLLMDCVLQTTDR